MGVPEFAITASHPRDLEWTGETHDRRASRWQGILRDSALADWVAAFSPTHLYLGSELCEQLLPSRGTAQAGIDCAPLHPKSRFRTSADCFNVRAAESGESHADTMATPALPAADFMALSCVASGRLRRSARSR